MNDVLPKPFTKEGLFAMLEKHLGHLKKQQPGMEFTVHRIAITLLMYFQQPVKDEDSPAASPATLSTHWNSPSVSQLGPGTGVSPAASSLGNDDYRGYGLDNALGGPASMSAPQTHGSLHFASTSPQQGSMAARQVGQGSVRRPISDIAGGEDYVSASGKRQQLYAQQPGINPMQAPRGP